MPFLVPGFHKQKLFREEKGTTVEDPKSLHFSTENQTDQDIQSPSPHSLFQYRVEQLPLPG